MTIPTTEVSSDIVIAKLQVRIAELSRDLAVREAQVEKLYNFIQEHLAEGRDEVDPV